MENKTTGILVALAVILSGVAGVTLTPDTTYYHCTSKGLISDCVNGLKACTDGVCTRCYYNETNSYSYEYCKEGWSEYTSQIITSNETINIVYANGGVYTCPVGLINSYTQCTKNGGKKSYMGELI